MFLWIDPIMNEARVRAEILVSESAGVQYIPSEEDSPIEPTHLHLSLIHI